MQLLDKLQYLRMMGDPAEKISPTTDALVSVLDYASRVWPKLDLKKRKLKTSDIAVVYQHGDRTFNHIKAFPRKMQDTFVIVVTNQNDIEGHILIDLAAEYSQPFLDCPSSDFEGLPTPDDLKSLIPQIPPDDDNPFAILILGEGTFMQTLSTDEGFLLEHQLVNTSCHYEIPEFASADHVVNAMVSYAFGKNEWLESFDWELQELE